MTDAPFGAMPGKTTGARRATLFRRCRTFTSILQRLSAYPYTHNGHQPVLIPPRYGGGITPLLFRGGEEPRSGGGVGFVRQTQHQPDKPHPNLVEGRGAFRVSPRHKVRITKAPPPPCFAWSRCCSATPAAPPCRGGKGRITVMLWPTQKAVVKG